MNEDTVIDLLALGMLLAQIDITRDAMIDMVRERQASGATPQDISAFLKALADEKLAELNSAQ